MGARTTARGEVVARGNTSDVLRWSATTVVKLLRPGIPEEWADREAAITASVHAAGLPAPATEGVVRIDGRTGILFEWIEGDTMWHRMKAAPHEVPGLIRSLVTLQTSLHGVTDLPGLPSMVARVRRKIEAAIEVQPADRLAARAILERLPAATALCHGDMHPANILMSARGPVVVDWFDAASGHPTADRARSSLLLRPDVTAPEDPPHLEGASRAFIERVHGAYLGELALQGLDDAPAFGAWEAVLAVARLAEPVPSGELMAIWDEWKAAGVRRG